MLPKSIVTGAMSSNESRKLLSTIRILMLADKTPTSIRTCLKLINIIKWQIMLGLSPQGLKMTRCRSSGDRTRKNHSILIDQRSIRSGNITINQSLGLMVVLTLSWIISTRILDSPRISLAYLYLNLISKPVTCPILCS